MLFDLKADYKPMGDQPEAIGQLIASINEGICAEFMEVKPCMYYD